MYLGLNLDELVQVVRVCVNIEVDDCTPVYFQEFLTKRLDLKDAVVSDKVRNLNDDQMDALCHYIHDTYLLIRPN